MNHSRLFLTSGAICGFIAVALGAFAAHGLKQQISAPMLAVFLKGTQYQAIHALALLTVGLLSLPTHADKNAHKNTHVLTIAGWSFLLGILLFSGSLYALALTDIRSLGMITPIGGLAFLGGWLSLSIAAWRLGAAA